MASQNQNVCPYILLTGKNKGQVCGKTISENGFCKLHAKKMNEVSVSCPFILLKGKNKGQECGKKTDESGYCKMHNPNQTEQPNQPEQPPIIQSEIPLNENKCPCILQSGEKKGQVCGKNISQNGFCKIHQKKCVQPSTLAIQPLQQPVFETKCPCVLQSGKNKGQSCGKEPIVGSKYCRFHQKTCVEPVKPVEPVGPVEPVFIEEKEDIGFVSGPTFEELEQEISPKSPLAELSDGADSMGDSIEPEQPEQPEQPEPEPIIEEEILKQDEWQRFQVSEEELQQIISNVQIKNIDIVQLNVLENEIMKCFG